MVCLVPGTGTRKARVSLTLPQKADVEVPLVKALKLHQNNVIAQGNCLCKIELNLKSKVP